MTKALLTEPEAEQELEEAAERYDQQRHGLGRTFLEAVTATVERIRRFPQAGARVALRRPSVRPIGKLGLTRGMMTEHAGGPFKRVLICSAITPEPTDL